MKAGKGRGVRLVGDLFKQPAILAELAHKTSCDGYIPNWEQKSLAWLDNEIGDAT
jgi:hypothetical protein